MRFVHFADLHLDHRLSGRYGNRYPQRVHDLLDLFNSIIDTAIEQQVDFVLFAGDMYHRHTPRPEYKSEVHTCVLRLVDAGIPFIAVPGNHDMTSAASSRDALYDLTSLRVPRVHVFHEPRTVDIGDVRIAGIPWCYMSLEELPEADIAVAHASVLGARYNDITSEVLLGKDFVLSTAQLNQYEYAAMGHIHKPQQIGNAVYPGSVGWHDWGETDEDHYFVLWTSEGMRYYLYDDRPRIKVVIDDNWTPPELVDERAFYRVYVPRHYPLWEVEQMFGSAFSLEVQQLPADKQITPRRDVPQDLDKMSDMDQLRYYFDYIGQDFPEDEFLQIVENVHT